MIRHFYQSYLLWAFLVRFHAKRPLGPPSARNGHWLRRVWTPAVTAIQTRTVLRCQITSQHDGAYSAPKSIIIIHNEQEQYVRDITRCILSGHLFLFWRKFTSRWRKILICASIHWVNTDVMFGRQFQRESLFMIGIEETLTGKHVSFSRENTHVL